MDAKTIITAIFLVLGCFFIVVASVGVVRFPDFYTRIHPAGKADTLGQVLVFLGLMVYEGFSFISIKLLIITVFIFIANPTATHALAKAAYSQGVEPWKKEDKETK
ncbi:MAG: monovalent cation/H(+) antiporter subunit G [Actinobacteria bacterium]|nr:monovalent cation/H(+) antiporter subunit G [Actinomycetota bacterium]